MFFYASAEVGSRSNFASAIIYKHDSSLSSSTICAWKYHAWQDNHYTRGHLHNDMNDKVETKNKYTKTTKIKGGI